METTPHRNSNRRTSRTGFRRLIASFAILTASCSQLRADIPWPEVVQRVAYENEKLARRPQGHNGECFVVCTLYYTPKESGFTFERGFDATPTTKPGLHGRMYPRDFLRSVKKEGFGQISTPVNGKHYISYSGGGLYSFAFHPPSGGGGFGGGFFPSLKTKHGRPRAGGHLERISLPVQQKV